MLNYFFHHHLLLPPWVLLLLTLSVDCSWSGLSMITQVFHPLIGQLISWCSLYNMYKKISYLEVFFLHFRLLANHYLLIYTLFLIWKIYEIFFCSFSSLSSLFLAQFKLLPKMNKIDYQIIRLLTSNHLSCVPGWNSVEKQAPL